MRGISLYTNRHIYISMLSGESAPLLCSTAKEKESKILSHLSSQRSDESEESEELVMSKGKESINGKEKGQKEHGNVNGKTTEQPSKKRKESSSPQLEVKKPSPEKKKVCEFSSKNSSNMPSNISLQTLP